jgi:integrase
MRESLNAIAGLLTGGDCDHLTLDWSQLRYQHTAAVRTALLQRYSPATASKMLCALRRVLKEAQRLELMSADDYARAADLPSIRENRELKGRALSSEEINAIMAVCEAEETVIAKRDLALIAILRCSGLRRGELVNLQWRDYSPQQGSLKVRRGKAGQSRLVYLSQEACQYLERWLDARGRYQGALLCAVQKGGRVEIRYLCSDAVLKVLRKRAGQAGVPEFSPHDFRRTFCSDLLDAGVDIVTVQKLAGHASPITTSKYDRRGEEVKRQAVQKLRLRQE